MDNNENEKLYNELREIENILKEQGVVDAFKPEWADCPDASLEVGHDYVYYQTEEICMRGHVLYNDGVTAILKVVNRYGECCFHVFKYDVIKQFYPAFYDPEATYSSEYFFIDIESEAVLLFRDPDDDVIKTWREDEHGEWYQCEVDPITFRMERTSKKSS